MRNMLSTIDSPVTQPSTMNPNTITMVSHASVVVELSGVRILTDPWQFGTAFNDSWAMIVPPADLNALLDSIDFVWISHEHPDHFHIPTLQALPDAFKQRVPVLFQHASDSEKMTRALTSMLGFANVRLLPHRQWQTLRNNVEVYCYHSRQIDSALALRDGTHTILNLNDCELSEQDLQILAQEVPRPDLLLNQFSIAGFDGDEGKLDLDATRILDTMVRDHRAIHAVTTVPFASFIYFCCSDNAKINKHINTPRQVSERFEKEHLEIAILYPGDVLKIGSEQSGQEALASFDTAYGRIESLPLTTSPSVPLATIQEAFETQRKRLVAFHGRLILRLLKPVAVRVPDLGLTVSLAFRSGSLGTTALSPDIEINSQPLYFMLANTFGLQTLGVSGRYTLIGDLGNWFRHRVLFSMMNAGIGLSPRHLLSRQQLSYFWRRRSGFIGQIRYRVGKTFTKSPKSP